MAQFEDNRLKPGMIADLTCMQEFLRRGLSEYDFMASDSRYKQEMSTGHRDIVFATLESSGLRWCPLRAAASFKRRRRPRTSSTEDAP